MDPGDLMKDPSARWLKRLHIDLPLLAGLIVLCGFGLLVLYSAGNQSVELLDSQLIRLGLGFVALLLAAQIPPRWLRAMALPLFSLGILLLILVLIVGDIGKGAQRWLDFGVVRFQPSELLKLAVPMAVAWWIARQPLPPTLWRLSIGGLMILVPSVLIAKQPDLGTAILVGGAGFVVLFLAGMSARLIIALAGLGLIAGPLGWTLMHDYQRQRVLTFLDPGSDPLGAGYHIIQSQIAIGSGGATGKGWLEGTQSHLEFLPERSTDFIFAVIGEEFGLLGVLLLLGLYLFIILRGLVIAAQTRDDFGRLLAGSLTLVFFIYLFVNTGMVSGLLPVVGVPLPLISFGGTSMLTIMIGFGFIMSVRTHQERSIHQADSAAHIPFKLNR